MANIGLKGAYLALKNEDGSTIVDATKGLSATGVFPIDTNKNHLNLGLQTANISALSGTPTKINGNNEVVDISNPPSSPTVALTANLINPEVKQKILGRVKLSNGVWVDGERPVYSGLIIVTQSPITLEDVYYSFGMGVFTETTQNVQTNTDTAETRESDTLTFTSMGFVGFNGKNYGFARAGQDSFDKQKLFDTVFPGQTFVTASKDGTADPSLHGGQSVDVRTDGEKNAGVGK
ncbi:phage tail protein [Limosilactobacillus sp. STM2_1]|uniref:Phage tail protein n=1 Tax=Limosilactobacillus rudii TaxID=2759755 RepID=A0A7W3UK51_9LACO|nr:phage tail protein [Limosilactobacillus rudii]MBB1079068.1 phage tail protein [Limosilactobacillus rudii]MBB1097057.1 phage tail protein [Limosilactobacillus rudii]MCD7134025.1 phage tail protein [Limosilactobacillus rudii]